MSFWGLKRNEHVRLVIEGYVVYNVGGFILLSNEKQRGEPETGPDGRPVVDGQGFEIPEFVVKEQPERILRLYPDDTLLLDPKSGVVWRYAYDPDEDEAHWWDRVNKKHVVGMQPEDISRLVVLKREDED